MTANLPSNEADLGVFVEKLGSSFSEAQESLSTGLDLPTNFLVANAELEVKVAVNLNAEGRTVLQTISAQNIREGGIDPGVLSTVRIGFVVTSRDEMQAQIPGDKSKRQPQDVIGEVRNRADIVALEEVLGDLNINTAYIPDRKRWLVTVRDPQGRLVREAILADELEEENLDE
jgi:hypothetical protein